MYCVNVRKMNRESELNDAKFLSTSIVHLCFNVRYLTLMIEACSVISLISGCLFMNLVLLINNLFFLK